MSKETRVEMHRFVQQVREHPFDPPYRRADMRRFSEKLERQEYLVRLREFDNVCERFHDTLRQEEDSGIPQVDGLKQRLKGKTIPSFSEFTVEVGQRVERKDASIMRLIQRIGERNELIERENQVRNFSKLLVSSHIQLFRQIVSPETYDVIPIINSALQEVIGNNFVDTALAQDLGLDTQVARENPLVKLVNLGHQEARELQMSLPNITNPLTLANFLKDNNVSMSTETRRNILRVLSDEPGIGRQILRLFASSFEEDKIFADLMLELCDDAITDLGAKENDIGDSGEIVDSVFDVIMDIELSEDTKAFWILAPWIYSAMTKLSLFEDKTDKEILSTILLWAKDGKVTGEECSKVHLQGLEFLSETATEGSMFGIRNSPNSESIRVVQEIAQVIAEKVLVKDEFDPDKAFVQ